MATPRITRSGIRATDGRLAKQIERTRKLSFPEGDDAVKYWFIPPPPPPIDPSKFKDDEVAAMIEETPTIDEPTAKDSAVKKEVIKPSARATVPAVAPPAKKQAPPRVPTEFRALVVDEDDDGKAILEQRMKPIGSLPDEEVLIRVDYTSLNYKDALAITGRPGVAGKFPLTPGIDAAGVVARSRHPRFEPGDEVIVTGFDLGMYFDGGLGEYICVPEEWVVRCPEGLTLSDTMAFGTAGFTAVLALNELERSGVGPRNGEILVTGATGGVGSLAVALLSQLGYSVTAVTGKMDKKGYLTGLGAHEVISRSDFLGSNTKKPMLTSRWAGIIDTVGGELLAKGLKEAQYGAAVTCCGTVAGTKFETTVYPFILRGIRLIGIDSVLTPIPLRNRLWRRISDEWRIEAMPVIVREVTLGEVPEIAAAMMKGESLGRVVVKHG